MIPMRRFRVADARATSYNRRNSGPAGEASATGGFFNEQGCFMRGSCWVVVIGLLLAGCQGGNKMMELQKQAFEQKKQEISTEVDRVMQAWLDEMVRTLPEDVRKYEKVRSPLVKWRTDSFNFDWRRPMEAATVKARGTPVEADFAAIPKFFDAMEQFWAKKIDFKDYMAAYNELKATVSNPLAVALADFDHTFVHVEAFYGAQDMEGDDRAIYFFRHWQVAFAFPREKSEAVSEYLARLCTDRMAEYCKTIPFEDLHFAMERPYLQEVKRIVGEYLQANPDLPLNRIFPPFLAEVDARMPRIPDFPEVPPLGDSISKAPFVFDTQVRISDKALEWEERDLMTFDKGWTKKPSEWKDFAKTVADKMVSLEKVRGPENLEYLLLTAHRDAPMALAAQVVQVFKDQPTRYLSFGARRRVDGLNKKTVTGRLQFREVPMTARTPDVAGVGKVKCLPLGQGSDSQELAAQVGPTVWLGKDGARIGTFAGGAVSGLRAVDFAEARAHLKSGPALLLVAEDVPVGDYLALMDGVYQSCGDEKCQYIETAVVAVEVQVCAR